MFFMMTATNPIFCVAYNTLVLPVKQWLQKLLKTHPQDGQLALCTVERQHRGATLFSWSQMLFLHIFAGEDVCCAMKCGNRTSSQTQQQSCESIV